MNRVGGSDIHPSQPSIVISTVYGYFVTLWDTTTMTPNYIVGQTIGNRGVLCFSTTLCILTGLSTGNYFMYTLDPSILPKVTMVLVMNSRTINLSLGRNPTMLAVKSLGLLFLHETTKVSMWKICDLSAEVMSWPSISSTYNSDVYCTATQCWHSMPYNDRPRVRSIVLPTTLQEGFLGLSIPHVLTPTTTFIKGFRFFNSENLIAMANSNFSYVYFYEKYPCHAEWGVRSADCGVRTADCVWRHCIATALAALHRRF